MRAPALWLLVALVSLPSAVPAFAAEKSCSYQTYEWNTITRRAENYRSVKKAYSDLGAEEVDAATGCSVCQQDQQWIRLESVEPIRVCKHLVADYEKILRDAIAGGLEIRKLVGYRVGKTRGDADADGRRTRFSNHSFGIALDVNPASNGLYTNCFGFSANCRLLRGGDWQPSSNPLSIAADSPLVRSMKAAGFKWGGEIAGRQKDFMHFSPTGY